MSKATFQATYNKNFDGSYSNVLPVKAAIGDLAGYIYDKVNKNNVEVVTDNKTLTEDDSGKTFIVTADAKVITLPATALGLRYIFINGGADGAVAINISPAAADAIHGVATLAASVVELSGVDNKDLINTKGTATTGNMVELVADGSTGWYLTRSTGIWASE